MEFAIELPNEQARCQAIDHVDVRQHLSPVDFFVHFAWPNKPVLIRGAINQWQAFQSLLSVEVLDHNSESSLPPKVRLKPDIDALETQFGNCDVPVAKGGCTTVIPLAQYLTQWRAGLSSDELGYCKDWHFVADTEDGRKLYNVPECLGSDWLNEYCDSKPTRCFGAGGDYQFMYLGKQGSCTLLHTDVFGSYSWSANVAGRKRWLFVNPCDVPHLRDKWGNLPTSLRDVDIEQFPNFTKVRLVEVVQEATELLFVPSMWYHEVYNLEDTLSINHNWGNACNIDMMFSVLKEEMAAVQRNLTDCEEQLRRDGEWAQAVETILFGSGGWNLATFAHFVNFLVNRRVAEVMMHNGMVIFELRCLHRVVTELYALPLVQDLLKAGHVPQDPSHKITQALSEASEA